ncbi:MAG TPA: DoxX family protein [Bryobacteraceae bacterium]|nr:DoxX family protein [Bryobacteraceae bacterium]
MKTTHLIGRILFGGFFLYSGIHHLTSKREMAQYAGSKSVPLPDRAVELTGIMLLIGGSSVLLGLKPKVGLAAIAAFLVSISPVMHNFWASEDPGEKQNQMINFMKNLALLGGALALTGAEEPWPASVPLKGRQLARIGKSITRALAA